MKFLICWWIISFIGIVVVRLTSKRETLLTSHVFQKSDWIVFFALFSQFSVMEIMFPISLAEIIIFLNKSNPSKCQFQIFDPKAIFSLPYIQVRESKMRNYYQTISVFSCHASEFCSLLCNTNFKSVRNFSHYWKRIWELS